MLVLRSALFNVLFFGWTAICCLAIVWTPLLPHRGMMACIRVYLHSLVLLERVVLGLRYRVIGADKVPSAPVIVAAKHQSAWETMKLHLLLDDPAIVIKAELSRIPLWGWYAARAGMIAVERGSGMRAVAGMIDGARKRLAEGRPIAIFPQGTRVSPGVWMPYRIGIFALYEGLGVPVVPMALNSGVFWPRRAFRKRPGTVTVSFLDPIPPGLDRETFMQRLTEALEGESDRLVMAEGGPSTPRGWSTAASEAA
jgi:1-acyl-sn-glycerol-3-phosphate acyltransferase